MGFYHSLVMGGKRYTEDEMKIITEAYQRDLSVDQAVRELNKAGFRRSPWAVRLQLSNLSNLSIKKLEEILNGSSRGVGLDGRVYASLRLQADCLKEYDLAIDNYKALSNDLYNSKSLTELLSLPQEKRKEISNFILEGKGLIKPQPVENIDLLLIAGYGDQRNNASLIMPLYWKDIKNSHPKGLCSTLNELTSIVLLGKGGFCLSKEDPQTNWNELLAYRLNYTNKTLSTNVLESEIREELKKEDYDVKVSFHTTSLFVPNFGSNSYTKLNGNSDGGNNGK